MWRKDRRSTEEKRDARQANRDAKRALEASIAAVNATRWSLDGVEYTGEALDLARSQVDLNHAILATPIGSILPASAAAGMGDLFRVG